MQVTRIENGAWPKDTYEVEHNGITLYIVPVPDGIEIDAINDFYTAWNKTDEQYEITFMEFPEPKYES